MIRNRMHILAKILFIILIISIPIYSQAHPGKTDSNGGHHDYKNKSGLGSYHYHHGYSAHLHENGTCPYDFNDITDHSRHSGSSSYSNSAKKETSLKWDSDSSKIVYVENNIFHLKGCPRLNGDGQLRTLKYLTLAYAPFTSCLPLTSASLPDVPEYREFKKKKILNIIAQFFVTIGIPALFVSTCCIAKKIKAKKAKDNLFSMEYDYYFSIYAFFPPEYFCNVPKGSYIKDGLPCSNRYGAYGKYTVYYSPKGECYHHRATCSRSKYQKSGNIAIAKKYHRPCSRCTPKKEPDLSWYYEYIRIREIKKKYSIP